MASNATIDCFWRWFAAHEKEIASVASGSKPLRVAGLVGPRVKSLDSRLAWEIGPGREREWAFVVSPNRLQRMLRITRRIIARAPQLERWEFHPARPQKEWDLCFEMMNTRGETVKVNAKMWRYALTSYNGGEFFDATVFARNLSGLDETGRRQAALIVLEGLLGEERLVERIGAVHVVDRVDSRTRLRLSPIQDLSEHLTSLERV